MSERDARFDHWQIDLIDGRVQLDENAHETLMWDMGNDVSLSDVHDIHGSPVRLYHTHIVAIMFITPESVAHWREWRRDFADVVDKIDPDGRDEEERKPWEMP